MTFTQRLRARLERELARKWYAEEKYYREVRLPYHTALALVEVLEAAAMDCECAGHMRQLREALARLDKEEC